MSTSALQRYLVRLQFDPQLVQRLKRHPKKALSGVSLTSEERAWLLAADTRAFGSDPLFAPRLLHAIVEEFAVSGALAVAHSPQGANALMGFFQSERAHRTVQSGGSLAVSFGEWLGSQVTIGVFSDQRIREVARLERAMAVLRRPGGSPGAQSDLVALLQTRVGTASMFGSFLEQLRSQGDIAAGVLEGKIQDAPSIRCMDGMEWVLCRTTERTQHGALSLEVLPDALAELVTAAAKGASRAGLLTRARALGAAPGQDEEIIAELESDALLAFES